MIDFTGQVAIVTGAGRGLGRLYALDLARRGASVVVNDIGGTMHGHGADPGVADSVVTDIARAGGAAVASYDSVDTPEGGAAIVRTATETFGRLDAVVSNAGIARPSPLVECAIEDWDHVFAVNTRAPFLLGRAAHAALRASRGAMVVVTSISGTHATSPLGAYSASKAATLMLVRQMAGEWGPDGIRVNALSPGLIVTPGTAAAYADPAVRAQREQRVPLRRLGEPEDMAAVAAFLLGPDAAYISGAELLADGGLAQTLMSSLPMGGWQAQIHAAAAP